VERAGNLKAYANGTTASKDSPTEKKVKKGISTQN